MFHLNRERSSNLRATRSIDWIDFWLAAVVVASVLIFIVWPVLEVIVRSFLPKDGPSFSMYRDLFTRHAGLIVNSLWTAALSTVLTLLFSLCIALFISFTSAPLRNLAVSILMLTMIYPPFVSSLAYILLFGKRGLVTYRLLGLSWNPYGWHGVVLMQVFSNISLAALFIIGMFAVIDPKLLEASRDLGARPLRTLRSIVLPLSIPGLTAVGFIVFIKCLSDFGTPIIIGGRFTLLATEAYLSVIGRADMPKAAAMSVLILAPSLLAFWLYRRSFTQITGTAVSLRKAIAAPSSTLFLTRTVAAAMGMVTWAFLLLMTLQYAIILISAVMDFKSGSWVLTLEYVRAVQFGKMGSLVRSVVYSAIAAGVGSLLGLLIAYYVERGKIPFGKAVDFMASLPYIMPGPFFGIGYILAFNDPPLALTGTGILVVLNCMYRQLPISSRAAGAALSRIGPDIENAARDVGSSPIRTLFKVVLPLLKPAYLVGFINTFTTTMTTVGAVIFLITPRTKVATVELFNVLRDGDYGQGAVLASLIVGITLFVNISFSKWMLHRLP